MHKGDGDWNDDDLPYTYSSSRVSGDLSSDQSLPVRFVDSTSGAGLFTTNSDPSVVGIDPLTGEAAPVGTDVGFGAAMRRYIQTGVLNGDFALPPPDLSQIISEVNPLPYWTWVPPGDGSFTLTLEGDSASASGYALQFNGVAASAADCYIQQLIPVTMSQGQQYRLLASFYTIDADYWWQFYKADGTTAIGSEIFAAGTGVAGERKIDVGLVPTNAAYLLLKVGRVAGSSVTRKLYEIRVAFVPAEASLGLASAIANSAGITTTETVVESILIPAGTFTAGSVYRVTLFGTITSSAANSTTFRVRIGTTTLTGNVITSTNPTATTTASNDGFEIVALLTIRSVGAGGTAVGYMRRTASATQPWSTPTGITSATGTVAVDTTVANLLEVTVQTGAATSTVTIRQALIECVMAS